MHTSAELIYVVQGECICFSADRKSRLPAQEILYIQSGDPHYIQAETEDCFICKISFSPDLCSRLNHIRCCSTESVDDYPIKLLRTDMNRLLWTTQSGQSEDSFKKISLYYQLMDHLENYFNDPAEQADIITDLKAFIYNNYREELTLDALAKEFHFSSAYLSRMFKQKFGQNFVSYLNHLRLEQAAEEVKHTDNNIMMIAVDNGFTSVSNFYKQFKAEYGIQPLDYRKQYRERQQAEKKAEEEALKERYLREYLQFDKKQEKIDSGKELFFDVDINDSNGNTCIGMTELVNVGPIENYSKSKVRQSLRDARGKIGVKYLRVWNVMPDSIFSGEVNSSDFQNLDSFLEFAQQEGMIPYLELGKIVWKDSGEQLLVHQVADVFKKAINILVKHIAFVYSSDLPVYFELRQFEHQEGVPNQIQYFDIYSYLVRKTKMYLPQAKTGGPGVYLLNYIGKEESVIVPWIKEGIYPDFLSVKLLPYSKNANGYMKPIADAECIRKSLVNLKKAMFKYSFGQVPVHANYCDSFYHEKCYLNDGLWKAVFAVRLFQDCLEYVDLFSCGQLIDYSRDREENELVLIGENGALCRNGTEKPLYGMYRCMRSLGNRILCSEPGCMISRVSGQRFRIVLYNYRHLNFLFYSNSTHDLPAKDVEMYLDEAGNKTFHICLNGVENNTYIINRYIFTKDRGSILDAWQQRGGYTGRVHGHWLDLFSSPDVMVESVDARDGKLELDYVLKPLEFMSIEVIMYF